MAAGPWTHGDGLATPLSVVAAQGHGASRGLLVKGGLYLEALAKVDTLVIDKTGTLTYGSPAVTDVLPFGTLTHDQVLRLVAALEQYAQHLLASAVVEAAARAQLAPPAAAEVEVVPSRGVVGQVDGRTLLVGARRLLQERSIALPAEVSGEAQSPAENLRLLPLRPRGNCLQPY